MGCAIIHEPELLFLDEPTAGVDIISRSAFWDLLYDLAAGGTTVFVTTHYLDEAEHCHRLAFIQHGRIVAVGSPGDVKGTVMHGEVLEIDCDEPGQALQVLRELDGLHEVALYSALVHVVAQEITARIPELKSLLTETGVNVRTMEVTAPSLEDAFVSSVRRNGALALSLEGNEEHGVGSLMYKGKLVFCDTPEAIRAAVVGDLVELRPRDAAADSGQALRRARTVLQGAPGVTEVQIYGDLLHVFVADGKVGISLITQVLREAGISATDVRQINPRMEQAFISLIRRQGVADPAVEALLRPTNGGGARET